MVECRFCRTVYVDNTVFCESCGQYLLPPKNLDTMPLDSEAISWVGEPVNGHKGRATFPANPVFPLVCLDIEDEKRTMELVLNRAIILGRMDPALNIFPEVDLTYSNGLAQTISRRHACISRQEAAVVVEDLASTNGTFLNGKRLIPFLPETLNDGDMLQLGQLLIKVKIKEE